jgi:hypothetical protein
MFLIFFSSAYFWCRILKWAVSRQNPTGPFCSNSWGSVWNVSLSTVDMQEELSSFSVWANLMLFHFNLFCAFKRVDVIEKDCGLFPLIPNQCAASSKEQKAIKLACLGGIIRVVSSCEALISYLSVLIFHRLRLLKLRNWLFASCVQRIFCGGKTSTKGRGKTRKSGQL